MKKYLSFVLLIVLLGIAFPLRAQVTIKIERLSKPDSLLPVQSPKDIFKTFIEEDAGSTKYAIEKKDAKKAKGNQGEKSIINIKLIIVK
jgi:hypothetical protein